MSKQSCLKPRQCAGAVLVLLATLGGCSLAPPYVRPDVALGKYSPTDMQPVGGQTQAADLAWQDYFADPRLRDLVRVALDNSRDLRAAVLRVEEVRAAYGITRAERFPTIGLGADGARSRTPADLNVTRRIQYGGQYQVGLGLVGWELDFWGRVRNLETAALESFLSSDAARRAATVGLVAQVADAYLGLRELDERIALARHTVTTREEAHRIFRRRVEEGATSRLDLTQVETLLTQAQGVLAQLEQARALQAHALTRLVGAPVDLLPQVDGLDDGQILHELDPGLPSMLLAGRPDIMAAEHQLKAANANIGAARAAFFPRIALTASAGTASASLDGLFEAGSGAWRFAPSMSLPIFDAGRNRAALALAEVRRDQAVAGYEKAVQQAFREVADALAMRHWLEEQVRIQRVGLSAQSERARLAKLRYDNGAARYLEVLDAQRDLLAIEQQLVQTRRALLSSRVALYAALGGGSRVAEDD